MQTPLGIFAGGDLNDAQTWRTAVGGGALVLLLIWETLAPMYGWFKGQPRARATHALRNLTLGALNVVIVAAAFVHLWLWACRWAETNRVGLLNWILLPIWARAAIAILLLDAWMYAWHRINHRVPFLWRFHRVHHADRHMDVTSATRFHLGEIAMSGLLRVPLIFLFGIRFGELVVYETLLFAVVQFHHANIRLAGPIESILSKLIVTPGIHRVHHSRWQPETDSNYASLFSFWDALFGTRKIAAANQISIGLNEFTEKETLVDLMAGPLRPPRSMPVNRSRSHDD